MVSPLRRTLETAYNVYKTHPNFDKIKFLVVPNLRECLNTSSDIPVHIEETIREFRELIPQLDFSLFDEFEDRPHYFLEAMHAEVKDKIKSQLVSKDGDSLGSNCQDLILEMVQAAFPERLEVRWNIFDRANLVKKLIKKYIEENNVPGDEKIVLVTHYVYCYLHTGKWNKEYTREESLPMPDNCIIMDNCDLISDPTDYSLVEA